MSSNGWATCKTNPDYWEETESFESLHSNLSYLNFDLTLLKAIKGG